MGKNTFNGLYILLVTIILSAGNAFGQCPTVAQSSQSFCNTEGATVANLVATDNGGGVQWYGSATSTAPLVATSPLQNGATYYADDSTGTCGTRESVTVTIYGAPTGPNFQGFCITSDSEPLPTLADLVVTGTNIKWYSASSGGTFLPLSTTLSSGTIYYASQTPTGLSCETTRLGVSVTFFDVSDAPVGASEQFFCENAGNPPTIGDLVASGNNNWYATADSVVPLSTSTLLVNGATYYSTVVVPPCESESRLPVTVTLYPENIAGNNGLRIICENDIATVGTVDLFAELGGTPDIGGDWSGPLPVSGGVVDITGMTVGDVLVFTYTVTNSINCPPDTANVTIMVPTDPDAGTPGTVTFCITDAGGDLFDSLNGTPETGGVWTPALNSGTGFFDPSVDAVGVYTYTVTSPGNCSQRSTTVTVDVIDLVSSGNFTGIQDICSTDGSFDLFNLLDGTQNAGGTWTNGGGVTVSNPIDITVLTLGDYDFTYTTTNACFTSSTAVTLHISNPYSPGVFTGMQEVCVLQGTLDLFTLLDGSEEPGGDWTDEGGNPVTNPIDISLFATDIYNYTYSVNNICGTFSANVSVHVFTPPVAGNFTGLQQNCDVTGLYDLFTLLDGTQDIDGVWTNSLGNVITNPINVSSFPAGTYSYTYTVTNVCGSDSEIVSVSFATTPNPGTANSIDLCPADAPVDLFTVLGGTPDAGGTWSPALNSGTGVFDPSIDASGDYTYTVTSSGGCLLGSATVSVTILPLPHSGVFTGLVDVCNTGGNFDLFGLLDGTEDAGGIWLDSSNNTVTNIVDLGLLTAGTYSYTYQVTKTCDVSGTVVSFNVDEPLSSGAFTGTQNICVTLGTFDLFTLLDGSEDIGGDWVDSTNNIVANPIDISSFSSGIYNYTYTLTNACGTFSTAVNIDVDTAPNSGVFTGVMENCTSIGFFDLFTLLNGSQDGGGVWLDSSNTVVPNPVDVSGFASGTYTYTYSVTNACGNSQTTVSLFFPDTPNPGTNGNVSICPSGAPVDLFAILGGTPDIGGDWLPALASGTGVFDPTIDTAGAYTYTVTTSGGCLQSSATVTVTILPLPNSGTFTGVIDVCTTAGNFNLFTLLDGSQDAGGVWTNSLGATVTNPIDVSGFGAGTYTFTYTVTSSCGVASTEVSFNVPEAPNAGENGTVTFCTTGPGDDLFNYLGGTPETTGVWSPLLNSGTGVFDPTVDVAGVYTYTVTSAGGCTTDSATVTVSFTSTLLNSGVFTGLQDFCNTVGTIDLFSLLDGSQEAGGEWTDSTNTVVSNLVDITAFTSGTYTYSYSVTNPCGASTTDVTFNVDESPVSGVFTGLQDFCATVGNLDLFTLLDGSQDGGGQWTNSSNVVVPNPINLGTLSSGNHTYTYTVTNACGTVSTGIQFTLSTTAASSGVFTGLQDFCNTVGTIDLFSLLDGSQEAGGEWTDSTNTVVSNLVDITGFTSGTYTYSYSVTNPCGASTTDVTFNVDESPVSGVFTGLQDFCATVGNLDLFTLLDGSQDGGGQWTNSSNVVVPNPINLGTLSSGNHTYTYTVTNACGTVSTGIQFTLSTTAASSGVFTGLQDFCNTVSTIDLFSLLDGSQEAGGEWTDSTNTVVSNLVDITGFTSGTYTYSYSVTNPCGASTTDVTFNVDESPVSGVFTGLQDFCATVGNLDLFTLLDGSQDGGGQWLDALNNPVSSTINISSFTAGMYNYTYNVTNACGTATASVSFTINVAAPSAGVFTGSQLICGASGTLDLFTFLDGSQNAGGQWLDSSNNVVVNPIDLSTLSEGTYTFTYSVSNGCGLATATISFGFNLQPSSGVFTGIQELCTNSGTYDLFALLDGSQLISGTWTDSNGNTVTNIINISLFTAGTYTYTYTASNSCGSSSTNVVFTIPNTPSAGTDALAEFCITGSSVDLFTLLGGSPDTGGTWSPALSSGTGVFNPAIDAAGVYTYMVSTATGCSSDDATVTVTIVNGPLSAGNFIGIQNVCNIQSNFDLFTLLDGTQDSGGVWTDVSGTVVSNPIDLTNLPGFNYEYTYTVTNTCGTNSETVQFRLLDVNILANFNAQIPSQICLDEDFTVIITNLPNGSYIMNYSISGSNTLPVQTQTINITGGSASFTIPGIPTFSNPGITTFNILSLQYSEITTCAIAISNYTEDFEVLPDPEIQDDQITIDSICFGQDVIVAFNNLTLADATYEITYTLQTTSGSDSFTATVVVSGGSAVITIPASDISVADTYLFSINTITNTDVGCQNLNSTATALFQVHPFPSVNVAATKLLADGVCLGFENTVTIKNNTLPDNTYYITYQLSGATSYTSGEIEVVFTSGQATFVIDEGILINEGTVTVALVTLTDDAMVCPVQFTNLAQIAFDVFTGETPELADGGNIFCVQDYPNPTLADLTDNIVNPVDTVLWFDSATGGTQLDSSTPITEGMVVYGVYEIYLDCPLSDRLMVTVDIEFCDIIIPDGFSPNNDHVNDSFEIKDLRFYYPEFTIEIFNRYGTVLYRGNYNTPDWDGKVNTGAMTIGENGVPTGVYFYILTLNTVPQKILQGRLYLNR